MGRGISLENYLIPRAQGVVWPEGDGGISADSWSTSAMDLLSPKNVVLGILIGYPATEVDLLIPSEL